jgi:hypothetical protein
MFAALLGVSSTFDERPLSRQILGSFELGVAPGVSAGQAETRSKRDITLFFPFPKISEVFETLSKGIIAGRIL